MSTNESTTRTVGPLAPPSAADNEARGLDRDGYDRDNRCGYCAAPLARLHNPGCRNSNAGFTGWGLKMQGGAGATLIVTGPHDGTECHIGHGLHYHCTNCGLEVRGYQGHVAGNPAVFHCPDSALGFQIVRTGGQWWFVAPYGSREATPPEIALWRVMQRQAGELDNMQALARRADERWKRAEAKLEAAKPQTPILEQANHPLAAQDTEQTTSTPGVDMDAILAQHREVPDSTSFKRCWKDGQKWPCDAHLLAIEVGRLRRELGSGHGADDVESRP